MSAFVVEHGSYKVDALCPRCETDSWTCYPGKWPTCWNCGVIVLRFGRTPAAKCVAPSGHIDSHLSFGRKTGRGLVCAFCEEP